jgi:Ala-tRNA(Pro) deacylase
MLCDSSTLAHSDWRPATRNDQPHQRPERQRLDAALILAYVADDMNSVDEPQLLEAEAAAICAAVGAPFTLVRHPPAFTAEDGRAHRSSMPGGHTKTLFLKSKKDEYVLAVIDADGPFDVQALARFLGVGRLSFCSAERLMDWMGLTPGSVTPLALKRAAQHELATHLQVAADRSLVRHLQFWIHPLHNAASVAFTCATLEALAKHCGFLVHWFGEP